jgi:menaquinone-9 beta-reductase
MASAGQAADTSVMSRVSSASSRWDVLIIGARCAGATLATYLGRAGASVLLVDSSPLPSDLILSTHTLHPGGTAVLRELGLSSALREVTPPIRVLRIGRGSGTLDLHFSDADAEYCPRRERFDSLLQDAAREAGVTVRDRTTAKQLLWHDGRAVGVRLSSAANGAEDVYADWIVGADGRESWLARQVGAPEYLGYDAARAMYWSYWDAPRGYGSSSDYPCGMYVVNRDGMIRVAFLTDGDQVLVGSLPERHELEAWRRDPLGALQADLARDEMLGSFTRDAPRARVRGFLAKRYFLRQAVGPGWMLIGDAGVHKEFVTGDGMTEALRQARSAAAALLESEAAVQRWWGTRDAEALPYFLFGKLQGAGGVPSALDALVLSRAARSRAIEERFIRSLKHEISPLDVVSPAQALGWVLGGVLLGRWGLLRDFLRRASAAREVASSQARYRALAARS